MDTEREPVGEDMGAREAAALRETAGLVEVEEAGCLRVSGADRISLLQRLTTGDLNPPDAGRAIPNHFVTAKGRLIDRVRILIGEDDVRAITSPLRSGAVKEWLEKYTIIEDVRIEDETAGIAAFSILGPRAFEAASDCVDSPPSDGRFAEARIGEHAVTIAGTEGLLEHPGVLFLCARASAEEVRSELLRAVRAHGGCAVGEAAFEAVRIECGLPRFLREVDDDDHPLEAGFWDGVSFDKGCYVGQEVLARLRNYDKIMRHLCRIELPEPIPAGTRLFADGREVGSLGAVAVPPLARVPCALGYVKRRVVQSGAAIRAGDPDHGPEVRVAGVVRLDPRKESA